MTRKRGILLAIGAAAAAGVAFLVMTGLGNLIVTIAGIVIQTTLVPSTISWDSHAAEAKCSRAISHLLEWPPTPAGACEAMHMCANEAPLSESQRRALYLQIRNTPRCQEP
jgi:hypothetical protein